MRRGVGEPLIPECREHDQFLYSFISAGVSKSGNFRPTPSRFPHRENEIVICRRSGPSPPPTAAAEIRRYNESTLNYQHANNQSCRQRNEGNKADHASPRPYRGARVLRGGRGLRCCPGYWCELRRVRISSRVKFSLSEISNETPM